MNISLSTKSDFEPCCARMQAWDNFEIIDCPPIRFYRHNAECEVVNNRGYTMLAQRWEDAEYQAWSPLKGVVNHRFLWVAIENECPEQGVLKCISLWTEINRS